MADSGAKPIWSRPATVSLRRPRRQPLHEQSGTQGRRLLSAAQWCEHGGRVVSGTVALILEANRTAFPAAPLKPNAVKGILQYVAARAR